MTPHRQSFDSVLAQLVAVHHHEVQALRRQLDQVILPEATGCSDVAEEAVGEALLSRPSFCRAQSKLGFADPWGPRSEQEPAVLPCGEITIEALETDESVHSVRSDLAEETGNNDETMRAPAQESRVARLKQALQQNVEQVGLKRKSRKRILALSRSLTIETEGKLEAHSPASRLRQLCRSDDHLEFFPDGMGSRDTDHFTDDARCVVKFDAGL